MSTSRPKWDPEEVLFDLVNDHMVRFCGLEPNHSIFKKVLSQFRPGTRIMPDGIYEGDKRVSGIDSLVEWVVNILLDTPDGILNIASSGPTEPTNQQSALYNAVLETLRTSRGKFFSAEQVAERVHYSLLPNRKRRLRQLRRLLQKVCANDGARRQPQGRNKTLYGFR